jgi:hypothetical protein
LYNSEKKELKRAKRAARGCPEKKAKKEEAKERTRQKFDNFTSTQTSLELCIRKVCCKNKCVQVR